MKKIQLFTLAIMPLLAFGQKKDFTIKGKIGNYNSPVTAFMDFKDERGLNKDSAVLQNGVFTFKGKVGDPVRGSIYISHNGKTMFGKNLNKAALDHINFYFESGVTTITGKDSIMKSTIHGSQANIDFKDFKSIYAPVDDIGREGYRMTSAQKADQAFQKRKNDIHRLYEENFIKFIKTHPDSFVSFELLKSAGNPTTDSARLAPLFNGLSARVKNSETGKRYAIALEKRSPDRLGMFAADFEMKDANGKSVKLSDFRGKYVLLDFWASWCGPCRKENPNVLAAYHKFKNKKFTVLGVALEKQGAKADWLAAIQKDGLPWTQVTDFNYFGSPVAQLYKVESIPHNFLIDPSGKIIALQLRGDALDKKLAELLK